ERCAASSTLRSSCTNGGTINSESAQRLIPAAFCSVDEKYTPLISNESALRFNSASLNDHSLRAKPANSAKVALASAPLRPRIAPEILRVSISVFAVLRVCSRNSVQAAVTEFCFQSVTAAIISQRNPKTRPACNGRSPGSFTVAIRITPVNNQLRHCKCTASL